MAILFYVYFPQINVQADYTAKYYVTKLNVLHYCTLFYNVFKMLLFLLIHNALSYII
jgi:hypothetical protein